MSSYAERRRQLATLALQEQVFESVVAIFEEEGLSALTMERIARASGISRGTLYNYFSDRDEVLVFIEARIIDPLVEQVQAIARDDGRPALERMEQVFSVLFRPLVGPGSALVKILFDTPPESSVRQEYHRRKRTALRGALAGILLHGQHRREVREGDVQRMAEIVLGAIYGTFDGMIDKSQIMRPVAKNIDPLMAFVRGGVALG